MPKNSDARYREVYKRKRFAQNSRGPRKCEASAFLGPDLVALKYAVSIAVESTATQRVFTDS